MRTADPSDQPGDVSGQPDADLVRALADRAQAHDGVPPLNDAALLALSTPGPELHAAIGTGTQLTGYGQLADGHVQLVVDPTQRRRGIAGALLNDLSHRADKDPENLRYWAFGDQPAAHAWAQVKGLKPDRILLVMARDLDDKTPTPPPPGVTIRAYRDTDAGALLDINARAFAHHPEQGAMDATELAQRMAEPWYRDDDILIAEAGDTPIGFHWTKRHDDELGEVYVLAVDPNRASGGVGRALLAAGLHQLARAGLRRVILYVEGDQQRVVDLYLRAGFLISNRDVVYAAPGPGFR